jgi:hypothetical protein
MNNALINAGRPLDYMSLDTPFSQIQALFITAHQKLGFRYYDFQKHKTEFNWLSDIVSKPENDKF